MPTMKLPRAPSLAAPQDAGEQDAEEAANDLSGKYDQLDQIVPPR